ncbi:MAG: guanylate kinase [Thermodesulfobacteriota bacterium]
MVNEKQIIGKGKGLVFIISAPSGTGKTTLVKKVMEELPGLRFSVSYTTRPPRANEQEGEDYHFVSPSVFQEMVERDEFIEWAEVFGNRYGTPKIDRKALELEEVDLILDIDPQGAKRVKEKMDSAVSIYLLPPSMEALQERLMKRELDSPEMIQCRLSHAKRDMEEAHNYQYIIVNDKMEETVERLKAIIIEERDRKGKALSSKK